MENMFGMLNNPDIMESMQNLMKNEDIQKMMQNKDFINNLQNMKDMVPNTEAPTEAPAATEETAATTEAPAEETAATTEALAEETAATAEAPAQNSLIGKFLTNETVITKNLKNETFNNKIGVIQEYNDKTKRYIVLFEESNKLVSIKEENIDNNFDNIELID
jgi:hypothetical protein